MYLFADTISGPFFDKLLPDDFDFDVLDEVCFIEIELPGMGRQKLTPDPILGFTLAFHYAKTEPVIMLGLREYKEFPEWDEFINRKNVAFCRKNGLTRE